MSKSRKPSSDKSKDRRRKGQQVSYAGLPRINEEEIAAAEAIDNQNQRVFRLHQRDPFSRRRHGDAEFV